MLQAIPTYHLMVWQIKNSASLYVFKSTWHLPIGLITLCRTSCWGFAGCRREPWRRLCTSNEQVGLTIPRCVHRTRTEASYIKHVIVGHSGQPMGVKVPSSHVFMCGIPQRQCQLVNAVPTSKGACRSDCLNPSASLLSSFVPTSSCTICIHIAQ